MKKKKTVLFGGYANSIFNPVSLSDLTGTPRSAREMMNRFMSDKNNQMKRY